MAQYYVRISKTYEEYIEADSEMEAIAIAEEALNDGDFGYSDCDVELCEDEDDEEDED
jgi:hypothetical protein